MNLKETPDTMTLPATHYVFVEKVGPFMQTAPKAWQELHRLTPEIEKHNRIAGYMSLYKVGPKIYRAGLALAEAPKSLPAEMEYERFEGGKYSRFVLTGPYSDLPAASGRVFEIVAGSKIPVRNDYYIENYVNDPRTTPEEKLITEILVPTK